MTQAVHWLYQAKDLTPDNGTVLYSESASRVLSVAAAERIPAGRIGYLYLFKDGSRLVAGQSDAWVLE